MTGKEVKTNIAITRTQERWRDIEQGISSHAALLGQLSQISEKFQATDAVFSDFKQTQQNVVNLGQQLAQYRESLAALQSTVEAMQQKVSMGDHSSDSLSQKWAALQQSINQIRSELQPSIDSLVSEASQHKQTLAALQAAVESEHQMILEQGRSSKSLQLEFATLQQLNAQTYSTLQSTRDSISSVGSAQAHMKKLKKLTSLAVLLGCLSLALSVVGFLR